MKYLSSQLLDDLYQQTEKNISKAIIEWQRIPGHQMTTQPGPGQWSAAQCLEHLNSYGRYYLPAIEKAINRPGKPKAAVYFKSGWLGNYFYKIMLPGNDGRPKKKMRSPKDHQPSLALNAVEGLNEFISQLELLGRLLTDARDIDINNAKVPISISPFIKLKLGDVFLFFIAHLNRHMLQAERALKCAEARSVSIARREPGHSALVST
ncbi:MAG TPA: DinB family protein [Ferruginibacter sp.]|nr:DinB family protein [Ferruginibacter sp.]